jgi:hypothetical protein
MKTVLLLMLAMLAIKTTTTTSATGQEACSKGYIACVSKCVGRPSAATQETNATPAGDAAALPSDEEQPKAKKAAKPTKTAKPRERAERRQQ